MKQENEREKERLAREQRRLNKERSEEIQSISNNVSLVPNFPVAAVIDYFRRNGSIHDFLKIRSPSKHLSMSWSEFEGYISVGRSSNCQYYGCDFELLTTAHQFCPMASMIFLREFAEHLHDQEEPVQASFPSFVESMRPYNLDLLRTAVW